MNRKTNILTVSLMAIALLLTGYCGSSQEKPSDDQIKEKVDETANQVSSKAMDEKVASELNSQLAKISLTGFPFGKTEMSVDQYRRWAKLSAPVVKTAIDKMPGGYVLEVQGHADAVGGAANNRRLSESRAEFIKKQLGKEGIASNKLTTKGYGESRLAVQTEERSAKNRRVTFKVVP